MKKSNRNNFQRNSHNINMMEMKKNKKNILIIYLNMKRKIFKKLIIKFKF